MTKTNALLMSMDWAEEGACKDVLSPGGSAEDRWFFPSKGQIQEGTWLTAVSRYCKGCPVRAQCETFGRTHKYAGVWGGILYNAEGKIVPAFKYWLDNGRLREFVIPNPRNHPIKVDTNTEVA